MNRCSQSVANYLCKPNFSTFLINLASYGLGAAKPKMKTHDAKCYRNCNRSTDENCNQITFILSSRLHINMGDTFDPFCLLWRSVYVVCT